MEDDLKKRRKEKKEDDLKKIKNEDDLKKIKNKSSRQPRRLIFGMQPYFDPTRKTTSKKKWKTTSNKNKK